MADLFENPMGLMGFEFVEFASPTPNVVEPVLELLGFTLVAKHRSKDVVLFRQGDINFIVNREPKSHAGYFAAEHGPSAPTTWPADTGERNSLSSCPNVPCIKPLSAPRKSAPSSRRCT